jgi:RNA polymerase sigma-70 factor (ECF subfamily)
MNSDGLVERFRTGDPKALEQLYLLHAAAVIRYLTVLLDSPLEAEDLAHTAWCKAIEHRQSLRDPRKFALWIRKIAHREALKRLAREGRYKPLAAAPGPSDHTPDDFEPHTLAIQQEEGGRVREALAALRLEYREILWLAIVDGLAHDEIAIILKIPAGTSRSPLHYALDELRRIMSPVAGGTP